MKSFLNSPLGILTCLSVCGFATVQTLSPVGYLKGGAANRVLTDNGTTAVWSASIAPSAVPSLDASKISTGTLGVARGGTGRSSFSTGDLLVASGGGALSALGVGSSNQVLTVSGGSPSWATWSTGLPAAGTARRLAYDNGAAWVASGAFTNGRVPFWSGGAIIDSGNLTFDGNTLTAVQGVAGSPGIVFKGASGATTDIFEVQDSSGAIQATVNKSGQFIIGSPPLLLSNSVPLTVYGSGSTTTLNIISSTPASGSIVLGPSAYRNVGLGIAVYSADTVTNDGARHTGGQLSFTCSENQSASSLGTDASVRVVPNGGSSLITRLTIRNNGDVELNGSENALSVSATSGFTYLPTTPGRPSGTPTSRLGNCPIVLDTANGLMWFHDGVQWLPVGGGSPSRLQSLGVTTPCDDRDTYLWDYSAGIVGDQTFILPPASTGRRLTFILGSKAPSSSLVIQRAGLDTITSGTVSGSTTIATSSNGSARILQSDGNSKWYVVSSIGTWSP